MEPGYLQLTDEMIAAIEGGDGESPRELRRAVGSRVACLTGLGDRAEADLPEHLETYVEKVALHAYRIGDADIDALREMYSQDAIFELTVCAAVTAGAGRVHQGMRMLREALSCD